MIDVEAWKFEIMEDVIVVGKAFQGSGNGLFGSGSGVRVGDSFFEFEACFFKGIDGKNIYGRDSHSPQQMSPGHQIVPNRYQQQKRKHGQDDAGKHVLVARIAHGKGVLACRSENVCHLPLDLIPVRTSWAHESRPKYCCFCNLSAKTDQECVTCRLSACHIFYPHGPTQVGRGRIFFQEAVATFFARAN